MVWFRRLSIGEDIMIENSPNSIYFWMDKIRVREFMNDPKRFRASCINLRKRDGYSVCHISYPFCNKDEFVHIETGRPVDTSQYLTLGQAWLSSTVDKWAPTSSCPKNCPEYQNKTVISIKSKAKSYISYLKPTRSKPLILIILSSIGSLIIGILANAIYHNLSK